MSCPDEQTWASYLRGAIDGEDADVLREHLDNCAACRSVVALVSADDAPVPLSRLDGAIRGKAPSISFKEEGSDAVTVRPEGEYPPVPAVTVVPSDGRGDE